MHQLDWGLPTTELQWVEIPQFKAHTSEFFCDDVDQLTWRYDEFDFSSITLYEEGGTTNSIAQPAPSSRGRASASKSYYAGIGYGEKTFVFFSPEKVSSGTLRVVFENDMAALAYPLQDGAVRRELSTGTSISECEKKSATLESPSSCAPPVEEDPAIQFLSNSPELPRTAGTAADFATILLESSSSVTWSDPQFPGGLSKVLAVPGVVPTLVLDTAKTTSSQTLRSYSSLTLAPHLRGRMRPLQRAV